MENNIKFTEESGFYIIDNGEGQINEIRIVFGGRIGVAVGNVTQKDDKGNEKIVAGNLGLSPLDKERQIGERINNTPGRDYSPIKLVFPNAASIDTVISALESIKKECF